MNNSTCSSSTATAYNTDFRRICEGLHQAPTLAGAEMHLMYALAFTAQIDPAIERVRMTPEGSTLYGPGGREIDSPWARAAWNGFGRMLYKGALNITAAEVSPVAGPRGRITGAALANVTTGGRAGAPGAPLHFYLEGYKEELDAAAARSRPLPRRPVW